MNATVFRARLAICLAGLLALTSVAPVQADGIAPKVVKKVPPEFPLEATRFKVATGVVKAKLSIDGTGSVTDVEILENLPPRAKVFNDAAVTALTKWKFEASGKVETVEIKLVFSQD
jgi:TonB family protein